MPIGPTLPTSVCAARWTLPASSSGRPARIAVAVADIRKAPRPDGGLNTQALYGDDVRVFDVAEGWAWIQAERDGYVGYVADACSPSAPARRRMSSRCRARSSIPVPT